MRKEIGAATLYTGRLTDETLSNVVTADFNMEDAYWVGLGLTRRIYTYRHYFDLEFEGQVNKFFGDQDNWEFDFLGYIRWAALSLDPISGHELRRRGGPVLRHVGTGNRG
jgi:hypothetical protein